MRILFTEPTASPMKTHDNELLILHHPDSHTASKTLAIARTMGRHVRDIDLSKQSITPSLLRAVLKNLEIAPKDLLNKAKPYYQANIRGRDFDMEGWLNIIIRNPDLLRSPIAIKGKSAVLCDSPTDIYGLPNVQAT